MRILFCIRGDYLRNFAGDSMQALMSTEYLRKKGISVTINNGNISDYSDYDIIQLFNLTSMGETYKYYKIARSYKKEIVLTPLYWDLKRYYQYTGDSENLKLWDRCSIYRAEIIKGSKIIFPGSRKEMELLKSQFGGEAKYKVIPNGVKVEDEEIPLYSLKERYKLDNYILCVGRICRMKNQLALAKVCNEMGKELVLIGDVAERKYYNECMKYGNVIHLGFMDSYNIYNAYRFAKLHVLPGFAEIPGLSSLEAAACGCNIISTREGCAEEYFEEFADYCDPYNENSICEAISSAYHRGRSDELKRRILENYTWEDCVQMLCNEYEKILA